MKQRLAAFWLAAGVASAGLAVAAGEVKPGAYCPLPEAGESPVCLDPAKAEYSEFFSAIGESNLDDARLARVEMAVAESDADYMALSSLAWGYYQLSRAAARTPGVDPEITARLERWNALLGRGGAGGGTRPAEQRATGHPALPGRAGSDDRMRFDRRRGARARRHGQERGSARGTRAPAEALVRRRRFVSLLRRMYGAARLHADTYEEVEADRSSIRQALLLMVAASASSAAAGVVLFSRGGFDGSQLAFQVTISALLPFVIWVGGSAFAFMTGASFFRGPETETDFAEVLRTTGFAFTPGLLLAIASIPPGIVGIVLAWLVRAWVLACAVVAIRQALDFTTLRAIGTFGSAAALLWLLLWGLAAAPLPF
jgi:hypothetical protein